MKRKFVHQKQNDIATLFQNQTKKQEGKLTVRRYVAVG